MSRTCPNCNYTRQASDSAPDWQCPACAKAYNKAAGAAVDANYGRYSVPQQRRASTSGPFKWILLLAMAGVLAWSAGPFWPSGLASAGGQATMHREQPEVTLYATDWCGYCAATRELFVANGIRYTELDIEKSSDAFNRHRQLGGNGVPLIVVGDEIVHGYNEPQLRDLLKRWFKST